MADQHTSAISELVQRHIGDSADYNFTSFLSNFSELVYCLTLFCMYCLTGVYMNIHYFRQYLHSYHYMFLCVIYDKSVCVHTTDMAILVIFIQVYSSLQVQPGAIPTVSGLLRLVNLQRYGDDALFAVVWSASIAAGLNTFHPNWMAIFFIASLYKILEMEEEEHTC